MFEDSLFASGAAEMPLRSRWSTAASVGVQGALLGVVIVLPLLRTAGLPISVAAPAVVIFHQPVVPPHVKLQRIQVAQSASAAMTAPSVMHMETVRRFVFHPTLGPSGGVADSPVLMAGSLGSMGSGFPGGLADSGTSGPTVRVAPASKMHVSSGVSAGLLLSENRPVYPRIAVAARVEGAVVITATIDKAGRIVGTQVTSGPAMLRGAAIDAVRAARYRPYLLNGEPTEVETMISVNFRIGG